MTEQEKSGEEKFRDLVLEKEREGKVVLITGFDAMTADLDEFIQQPAEGILYDLNRDKATILTFIEDKKWVNDYAVALTITKLKERIAELEKQLQETPCVSEHKNGN